MDNQSVTYIVHCFQFKTSSVGENLFFSVGENDYILYHKMVLASDRNGQDISVANIKGYLMDYTRHILKRHSQYR